MDDRIAELRAAFLAHASRYPDLRLVVLWGVPPADSHPDSPREVKFRSGLLLRYFGDGAEEFAALACKASLLLKPELLKFVPDWPDKNDALAERAWIESMTVDSPEFATRAANLKDAWLLTEAEPRRFCEFKLSPAAASVDFIYALVDVPASNVVHGDEVSGEKPGPKQKKPDLDRLVKAEWETGKHRDRHVMLKAVMAREPAYPLRKLLAAETHPAFALKKSLGRLSYQRNKKPKHRRKQKSR